MLQPMACGTPNTDIVLTGSVPPGLVMPRSSRTGGFCSCSSALEDRVISAKQVIAMRLCLPQVCHQRLQPASLPQFPASHTPAPLHNQVSSPGPAADLKKEKGGGGKAKPLGVMTAAPVPRSSPSSVSTAAHGQAMQVYASLLGQRSLQRLTT